MDSIELLEAQKRLVELVDSITRNGDVLIVEQNRPVARLTTPGELPSLRSISPASVGALLRPPHVDNDLLAEMLER